MLFEKFTFLKKNGYEIIILKQGWNYRNFVI